MNKILLSILLTFSSSLYSQSWEAKSDIPIGRHHPISFAIDGKGYAVTGTNSFGQTTKDVYQYDPVADSWTQLDDFPGANRSFGIGVVANGKAYLGFGANSQYLNDFWSFDPSDSSWTQLASCSCSGRRHPAMITVNNKIYVGLGDDFTGNLNDWWMYDISLNSWSQIANLPGPPRHHPFMFKASGELFAGLGHGNNQQIYKDWYKLDTVLNTWTLMSQFPGEARVAGTQFSRNGYGYVLSGDGDDHSFMPTGEMWEYNPNSDSWAQLTPHPGESRWAPGSFVIDDAVYFFGGLNRLRNIYPTNLWKFDFADTTTSLNEAALVRANTYAYPNPANEVLYFKKDQSISLVKIFSSNGKLVLESTATEGKLNTNQFNDGLYLVQFYDRNQLLIKNDKILIQH
jgi:N-acetylneuraminic acid mutarotase